MEGMINLIRACAERETTNSYYTVARETNEVGDKVVRIKEYDKRNGYSVLESVFREDDIESAIKYMETK